MNYRETKPALRFAGLVKCFWALEYENDAARRPEPVVPDGCLEIIFNLSDRFHRYRPDGSVERQPASIVAGQMQRSVSISPSGNVRLFGIRFEPAGAFPFFPFDLKELLDRIEPLELVFPGSVSEIEGRLAAARNFQSQVLVAEHFLAKQRIEKNSVDPRIDRVVRDITAENGVLPIRRIAKHFGVSERTLERRFARFVGLSPKSFARTVRFQSLLRFLRTTSRPNLLDAAFAFGYYDQSHLIGDFRQFTGSTPATFLANENQITEIFMTP